MPLSIHFKCPKFQTLRFWAHASAELECNGSRFSSAILNVLSALVFSCAPCGKQGWEGMEGRGLLLLLFVYQYSERTLSETRGGSAALVPVRCRTASCHAPASLSPFYRHKSSSLCPLSGAAPLKVKDVSESESELLYCKSRNIEILIIALDYSHNLEMEKNLSCCVSL